MDQETIAVLEHVAALERELGRLDDQDRADGSTEEGATQIQEMLSRFAQEVRLREALPPVQDRLSNLARTLDYWSVTRGSVPPAEPAAGSSLIREEQPKPFLHET